LIMVEVARFSSARLLLYDENRAKKSVNCLWVVKTREGRLRTLQWS
jgi:hypothetical protein